MNKLFLILLSLASSVIGSTQPAQSLPRPSCFGFDEPCDDIDSLTSQLESIALEPAAPTAPPLQQVQTGLRKVKIVKRFLQKKNSNAAASTAAAASTVNDFTLTSDFGAAPKIATETKKVLRAGASTNKAIANPPHTQNNTAPCVADNESTARPNPLATTSIAAMSAAPAPETFGSKVAVSDMPAAPTSVSTSAALTVELAAVSEPAQCLYPIETFVPAKKAASSLRMFGCSSTPDTSSTPATTSASAAVATVAQADTVSLATQYSRGKNKRKRYGNMPLPSVDDEQNDPTNTKRRLFSRITK